MADSWDDELDGISMGRHAMGYVRRGWAVVPLWWPADSHVCACMAGASCERVGKHPHSAHGSAAPITDLTNAELYWYRHPRCNVGVATGAVSGIVVMDIDPRHGGSDSIDRIKELHGPPSVTPTSITGGGGQHRVYSHPGGEVRNSIGSMPGIDIRGDGGLIVAPPSLHGSGARYEWETRPGSVDVLRPPDWLLGMAGATQPKNKRPNKKRFDLSWMRPVSEGGRNKALCSVVGRLIYENRPPEEVDRIAREANSSKLSPPLDDREVDKLLKNAHKRFTGGPSDG